MEDVGGCVAEDQVAGEEEGVLAAAVLAEDCWGAVEFAAVYFDDGVGRFVVEVGVVVADGVVGEGVEAAFVESSGEEAFGFGGEIGGCFSELPQEGGGAADIRCAEGE
nr:hypothetical protein [Nocardia inohanensis]